MVYILMLGSKCKFLGSVSNARKKKIMVGSKYKC